MKHSGAAVLVAAACLVTTHCRSSEGNLDRLPELPAELAANLQPSRTTPVLMTRAPKRPAGSLQQDAGKIMPRAVSKVCVRNYQGYVVYPIVVCYPPNILLEGLDWSAIQATERNTAAAAAATATSKYYKLTSFPNLSLNRPLFCSAKGGPWFASVTEQPRCDNINVSDFRLEIQGAPESVVLIWSGTLSDVPAPINPDLLTFAGEGSCICCNGGTLCSDGRCIPPGRSCDIGPPA